MATNYPGITPLPTVDWGSGGTTDTAAPTFNLGTMKESTDWTVDPKTQTVAGQLESVIAKDSPLLQQARTRATQAMNSRGLSNSTMAMGAADSALYDTALNIAAPDAQIYADAGKTNAAQRNAFAQQENQFNAQGSLAQYGAQANNWMADQNQGRDLQKMALQSGYDITKLDAEQQNYLSRMAAQSGYDLQKMDSQQINDLAKIASQAGFDLEKIRTQTSAAIDVADIEAQYKNITQGSASATSVLNKMQDSLNMLAANKDITDATVRQKMETDIKQNAMDSLQLIGAMAGAIDLSQYISDVGL